MLHLAFQATPTGFERAFEQLLVGLEYTPLDPRVRRRVELVFEEIASNIVKYAAIPAAPAHVDFAVELAEDAVRITFEDDGRPFDPTGVADAALPETLEAARIGGLGISVIRRLARHIEYRRDDAGNRLVVTLAPPSASPPAE